jgi:hypothetical protein
MEINSFTKFLTTPWLRWLFWISVTILNFYAFVHDPIRFSALSNRFKIPYKWFVYIARMLTFALDILTFLGLWFTIPFMENVPIYWFIPIVIVGFGFISEITVSSDVYSKTKEGSFNPPPTYLWNKNNRIILFAIIMLLNIFIFLQFYIASGISGDFKGTVLHKFFTQRFGGFKEHNYIAFIAAWLGILAFFFDGKMLSYQYNFTSCVYNLPDSWNF